MSVRQNGKIIAGTTTNPCLFDCKWADHILNDASWLRADTFSWQDGGVYQAAYNHLVADASGKPAQTETISGTTITYYLADDGHKIVGASEESNVMAIYNATGVAWYYILDETNSRFKLPRTKFGFTGLRDTVGNYAAPGLPNITGWAQLNDDLAFQNSGGAITLSNSYSRDVAGNRSSSQNHNFNLDASRSSSIYGASTTVQPPATQMYLYFYVGNFTQTALENTAGITAETLNDKVDKGHQVIAFQAPTAQNNYTWYRKYADGWVEQGGIYDTGGDQTASNQWGITLPIEMLDSHYTGIASMGGRTSGGSFGSYCVVVDSNNTTTALSVYVFKTETAYRYINWQVSGMAA